MQQNGGRLPFVLDFLGAFSADEVWTSGGPPWGDSAQSHLRDMFGCTQSEPNPHMPLSRLVKPVPPAMGVGREASETRRISGTSSRYAYMRRSIATSAAEQRPRTEALTPPAPKVTASLTQQLWGDQLVGVKIGMMI